MRHPGRRSKIVCTLGPATHSVEAICHLIECGMDLVRINFSHGTHAQHKQTIANIRQASQQMGSIIGILGDLQGPKIRTGTLLDRVRDGHGFMPLKKGQIIWFRGVEEGQKVAGDGTENFPISISYSRLSYDLKNGEDLLFDDGLVRMRVVESNYERNLLAAQVLYGESLGENKGVNMPSSRLSTLGITEKDWADISFALQEDIDILALSFVRSYREVKNLKTFLKQKNKNVAVIAKIEKLEAVQDIDNILQHADGIMVARGDLAVEVGNEKVPIMQKQLIEKARLAAKPVITATQMLMSMIQSPTPTRAEASDIANAVLDGTDALMLSNETAVGKYPFEAVKTMSRIIEEAERLPARAYWQKTMENNPSADSSLSASLAGAACEPAENVKASCLACLTRSGRSAQYLAQHRPHMPIFAFSADFKVAAHLCLTWGVFVIPWKEMKYRESDVFTDLTQELGRLKLLRDGDRAVLMAGIPTSLQSGTANTIHLKTYQEALHTI